MLVSLQVIGFSSWWSNHEHTVRQRYVLHLSHNKFVIKELQACHQTVRQTVKFKKKKKKEWVEWQLNLKVSYAPHSRKTNTHSKCKSQTRFLNLESYKATIVRFLQNHVTVIPATRIVTSQTANSIQSLHFSIDTSLHLNRQTNAEYRIPAHNKSAPSTILWCNWV